MIDQSSVNLLALLGGNFKRVAKTGGGEYAGPCPFCKGHDRFHVWPYSDQPRWWCRQCGQSGDAIAFVQQQRHVDFKTALAMLGLQGSTPRWQPTIRQVHPPKLVEPPSAEWQKAALSFVTAAEVALWCREHMIAPNWLRNRGFTEDSMMQFHLGYHPQDRWVKRADWGLPDQPPDTTSGRPHTHVWLPSGIVMPWFISGHLWKLSIRRLIPPAAWEATRNPPKDAPEPQDAAVHVLHCLREQNSYLTVERIAAQCSLSLDETTAALDTLDALKLAQRPMKHYQVPGGSNGMFNPDALQYGKPSVLVESTLDAIAIHQEAGDLITPVVTGTTSARSPKWIIKLFGCAPHLLSYDNDAGGNAPRDHWYDSLKPDAIVWLPEVDDPAAMLEYGCDLRAWIKAGLLHAGYVLPIPDLVVSGNDVESWYVCEQRGADLHHWFDDERCFATEEAAPRPASPPAAPHVSRFFGGHSPNVCVCVPVLTPVFCP
jgi:hypothetical protein